MTDVKAARPCQSCRERRIKCDRTLPACLRCSRSKRSCPGYVERQVFVDHFSKSRKRNENQKDESAAGPESHYAWTERSDRRNETATIDAQAVQRDDADACLTGEAVDANTFVVDDNPSTHTVESDEFFNLDIDNYYANGQNACGFHASVTEADSSIYPTPQTPGISETSGVSHFKLSKQILRPLLHVYVKFVAPWLDLLDIEAYFTHSVPVQATLDLLIQLALAAVAAKQIAYFLTSGGHQRASTLLGEYFKQPHEQNARDWFYDAAKYYDQGITFLRMLLTQSQSMKAEESPRSTASFRSQGTADDLGVESSFASIITAIPLLSFYENLDSSSANPSTHVSGFLALLISIRGIPAPTIGHGLLSPPKSAERAAFWYLARREMFAAYTHHLKPSFDPESGTLWISAGLPTDEFQWLVSTTSDETAPNPLINAHDPMVSIYVLIWLTTRVIQHVNIAPDDELVRSNVSPPIDLDERSRVWHAIRAHFNRWYTTRSHIFHAYSTEQLHSAPDSDFTLKKRSFFTSSTGAAAMQIYHFAQILLLLHEPIVEMSQTTRLQKLRQRSSEIEMHSHEIYAIASANRKECLQGQLSHPLRLAAMSFDKVCDRKMIQQLISEVSSET